MINIIITDFFKFIKKIYNFVNPYINEDFKIKINLLKIYIYFFNQISFWGVFFLLILSKYLKLYFFLILLITEFNIPFFYKYLS